MKLSQVYMYYGGSWANVANVLGLTRAAIHKWVKQGFIPLSAQKKIEMVSNGELKAELNDDMRIIANRIALEDKQSRTFDEHETVR